MELKIEEAMKELQEKDDSAIELETGIKWASRAAAAYILSLRAKDLEEKLLWLIRGEDLRHESLEHVALVGDQGKSLNELQKELDLHREAAYAAVKV